MYVVLKTGLIVILVVMTIWLLLRTNSYIDFRAEHIESPNGDRIVEHRGVRMRQGDFILYQVVAPRLDGLAKTLVHQSSFVLWCLLYSLYGIIGNYVFYLMALVRADRGHSSGNAKTIARFVARTVLAGLCGIICFLLVRWLASPVGRSVGAWLPAEVAGSKEWTVHSVSDSFLFLPIIAGIFVGTFFGHLESILDSAMDRIKRTFSGGK